MVLLLMLLALFQEIVEMGAENVEVDKTINKRSQVCYGSLGCFADGPPFVSSNWPLTFLPQSPNRIRTQFLLYTRESSNTPQELDARSVHLFPAAWTNFKARQTKIIVHGFLDDSKMNPLWKEMIKELLKNGDYNVIFVDWSMGNLPPYTQAVANTRVVGAQIAELVKAIVGSVAIKPSDFHIIGHSLGGQTAGYAGERIPGLGRISGLDPAGPYFEDTDRRVRLDDTDANFVDVIHTDTPYFLHFALGTKTLSGHLDFFPNLGRNQPTCDQSPLLKLIKLDLIKAFGETVICSHVRALKFFIESINSPCPYMAYPCASEQDFVNNLCYSCGKWGCQKMGFHAKKIDPSPEYPVKYYLTTGDRPPFCRYHYIVTIKLSPHFGTQQRGTLDLDITGSSFTQLSLIRNPLTFQTGHSYKFITMLPYDVGNVQALTLKWKLASSLSDVLPWNLLDRSNKSLFLQEIDIFREEAGIDARFCPEVQEIRPGGSLFVSKKC